jgi:cobalt-zinc-cadmium efflux system membrane fusion protein
MQPDTMRDPFRVKRFSGRAQALILAAAVGAIVVVVLVFGLAQTLFTRHEAPPPASTPGVFTPTAGQWANLKLVEVKSASFSPAVDTEGQIAANDDRTTQVFSQYTGRITKVFVTAGQAVKKGDPLYAIQANEFAQAESDLGSTAAAAKAARTALAVAQAAAQRQQELFKVQGAALKDVQQAQADLTTAESNLRTAEANLESARARARILGESEKDITALEVAPPRRGANPETVVRSPISGVVIQRQAGVGQYLQSAASGATTPLFSISDLSSVWLVANVREADAGEMRLGAPIAAKTLAFPDRLFEGRVRFVAPVIDPATRRLTVRAEIPNPGGLLRPQMYAQMSVGSGPVQTAPAVPEDAVLYEGDTARVWVVQPNGKSLASRQIKVGRLHDGLVEVLSGLTPGERVVSGGALFVDNASKTGD